MAHGRLRFFAASAVACILQACSSTPPAVAPPTAVRAKPAPFVFGDAPPGEFVSKRFGFRLHLPDGRAWRIDDHGDSFLLAKHALAATTLRASRFDPGALSGAAVGHDTCWTEAIARGVFTTPVRESAVEDDAHYDGTADVRILVSIGNHGEGHVRYVSAGRTGCIVLAVDSLRLEGDTDETLADRLALVRQKVIPGLKEPTASTGERSARPWAP